MVVTNAYGSVTSSPARLTIVAPPEIPQQPTNQTILPGQSAAFIALVTNECGGGLLYQWRFNGTNLAGATSNYFSVANAQPTDAGDYALIVTNLGGSVTSSVATLTLLAPPLADFSAAPTSGFAPLTVTFTNLSAAASNYLWDFGDGNSSMAANTSNTYTNPGNYSVSLAAIGSGITNNLTRTNYILVLASPQLLVSPASLDFGVVFTNLSAYSVVAVSNIGAMVLNATATIPGGPFAVLDPSSNLVSSFDFDIPGLNSTNLSVIFSPVTVG